MMLDLPSAPPAIVGRASVIDGDTLEIRGRRIRLWGVDAPESRQTCERRTVTWRCGQEAANQLSTWLGAQPVACSPRGRPDRYGRIVAVCHRVSPRYGVQRPNDLMDVGRWAVRQGWALDYPDYSGGDYADEQRDARTEGLGLWSGTFIEPWAWRARR